MKVSITFVSNSVPVVFENVKDVYTKNSLLCVSFVDKKNIFKFPLCNVFMIDSDYQN